MLRHWALWILRIQRLTPYRSLQEKRQQILTKPIGQDAVRALRTQRHRNCVPEDSARPDKEELII